MTTSPHIFVEVVNSLFLIDSLVIIFSISTAKFLLKPVDHVDTIAFIDRSH